MKFFGDRRQKAERLRKTIPLGTGQFLRFEDDKLLFVCFDIRANIHRIELDKVWVRTIGMDAAVQLIGEAVYKARARLAKARRN